MRLSRQGASVADLNDVDAPYRVLRDLEGASRLPRARPLSAPHEPGGYRMNHGGVQRNGRLVYALPSHEWELLWSRPIGRDFPPLGLMNTQERVLVRAAAWQLFDLEGNELARQRSAAAGCCLDPDRGLLFDVDPDHWISAYSLDDGSLRFKFPTKGGELYRCPLLVRVGERLLLGGPEAPIPSHGHHVPSLSLLESWEPGQDDPPVDPRKRWRRPPSPPALVIPSADLHVALSGETLVLALPGHVFYGGLDLSIEAAYEGGPFRPLALCCDEERRAYLLLERDGGTELWVVTPSGTRVLRVDVPRDLAIAGQPPLVGYDHTLHFVAPHRILAVDQVGAKRWEAKTRGSLGGATLTADDLLLASEGDRVVTYDPQGQRRQLHHFDGDPLVTAPLITASGKLLVASQRALYCLVPQAD